MRESWNSRAETACGVWSEVDTPDIPLNPEGVRVNFPKGAEGNSALAERVADGSENLKLPGPGLFVAKLNVT